MIDLHTHTTASDGLDTPEDLVRGAKRAGIRRVAVTDHDTMAGVAPAAAAAARVDLDVVSGIEVTAVHDDRDIHVLGYFLDPHDDRLHAFLASQRRDRVRRVREMAARLAAVAAPVHIDHALAEAERDPSRSIGRPVLARALVAAGHALDPRDAFERLIGRGCPAYVPRRGASPMEVIALIHAAGGVASLAHPGQTACDDLVPALVAAGLDALEVRHPDHAPEVEARYVALARKLALAVTAGSDYHGSPDHGSALIGAVTMTEEEFEVLARRRRGRR